MSVDAAWTPVAVASLLAWLWLAFARGRFWQVGPILAEPATDRERQATWPAVVAVVPARNEAQSLPATLPALLAQDYPGRFRVVLVDDRSEDGTAALARRVGRDLAGALTVVEARPTPEGWTGKLWAVAEGLGASRQTGEDLVWLTDADILHAPDTLRALVECAQAGDRDLVSVMALLRTATHWERLLIPAFVFFFAKLYPFRWVNDDRRSLAAGAGGCMLLRRGALERARIPRVIRSQIIDDCAVARAVREAGHDHGPGRLWIGLSRRVRSARGYDGLGGIWRMVARSAYSQLRDSPALLALTVLGMLVLYVVPPLAAMTGVWRVAGGSAVPWSGVAGAAAWAVMSVCYVPMLRWHAVPLSRAPLLPIAGLLYTLMTVDSARRRYAGRRRAHWR